MVYLVSIQLFVGIWRALSGCVMNLAHPNVNSLVVPKVKKPQIKQE